MSTALVLAGHGSHISPETAGVVWKHVDGLRRMGVADEVTAAFWKEMPSFHTVFDALTSDDITVVPLFTAQGYFTQTVIPTEMGLSGSFTQRDGRTIRYTRTLNEHPYLGQIVRQRVEDAIRELNTQPENTAVVIIGHSTRRNPESRRATEAQAQAIRALGLAAEVVAVYLDDSPEIAQAYTLTSAPNLIAVPYFLALGSHTTIDVPNALSLPEGETRAHINGRDVYYTPPIGTEDTLLNVILELARETGAPLTTGVPSNDWQAFPIAGRNLLLQAVQSQGKMRFGQLALSNQRVHVWGDAHPDKRLTTAAALRTRVREQPFRPLATSTDLPGGWHIEIESPEQLHAVVETVYPGLVADWAAHQHGTFVYSTLDATAARQTGLYRSVDQLNGLQRQTLVEQVCGGCVRHPTWHTGETPIDRLPCPEACNFWLSQALESE